jgi:hypothetical protein
MLIKIKIIPLVGIDFSVVRRELSSTHSTLLAVAVSIQYIKLLLQWSLHALNLQVVDGDLEGPLLSLVGSARLGFVQVDTSAADFTLISWEVERNGETNFAFTAITYLADYDFTWPQYSLAALDSGDDHQVPLSYANQSIWPGAVADPFILQ